MTGLNGRNAVRSTSYSGGIDELAREDEPEELQSKRRHRSYSNSISRRHYFGSIDTLQSNLSELKCNTVPPRRSRYRFEPGIEPEENVFDIVAPSSAAHLENPENQVRWYFKYFLGHYHKSYVALDINKDPMVLSVCLTDADNYNIPQYRAILWRKTGCQRLCFPFYPAKPVSGKEALKFFSVDKVDKGPKEILDPEIQKDLLVLEEQEGSVNFKFGVIYAQPGQTSDDEMFSNVHGSTAFDDFIRLLGDRVTLKGWSGYRGGLDVKSNTTGYSSVYTVSKGHEIMFHVSTLLPFSKDMQQVERKRHIGNDICVIIFYDGSPSDDINFKPSFIRSKFTHVFAVVQYDKKENSYWLSVYSEENVPVFGPPLPTPAIFASHEEFRGFLLTKLMNGEKAAYSSPVFSEKRQRTLEALLKSIQNDHLHSEQRLSQRRSNQRKKLFLEIGQSLKVNKILEGHAPTSLANSGRIITPRSSPWEPKAFSSNLDRRTMCGDSLGTGLILASEQGITNVGVSSICQVTDASFLVKQVDVLENHGVVVMRTMKEGEIYVVPIAEVECKTGARCKRDWKKYKLPKAKGSHLYAISRPGDAETALAVGVNKKILVYIWNVNPVWLNTYDESGENPPCFDLVMEITLPDVALLMTLVYDAKKDLYICCGHKRRFDLIDIQTQTVRLLRTIEGSKKVTLVSALDVYEDDNPELLLTYNHFSVFQRLHPGKGPNVSFSWTSTPHSVVCAYPYVLGFTRNCIEIRLVVNGNLVHTLLYPKVQFITAKSDIYFLAQDTSSPRSFDSEKENNRQIFFRRTGETLRQRSPLCIYSISLNNLAGGHDAITARRDHCKHIEENGRKTISIAKRIPAYGGQEPSPKFSRAQTEAARRTRPRRPRYSEVLAMAAPVLKPVVVKSIDFGEDLDDSESDGGDACLPYLMEMFSGRLVSEPDLRAIGQSRENVDGTLQHSTLV